MTPTTISNLIASQFPAFYNESGPTLIAFIEAYYEWMEQQGNPIYQARNLQSFSDIDTTLDQFIVHFKNTYLQGIQFTTLSDQRLTVKKIIDLYRAKGNIRALKLLFQLVFSEDITVYFPSDDILKPSDGVWTQPIYLEVSNSPRIPEFSGKIVTGVNSGATAFVDKIITRAIGSKFINVFYITNLSKDFQTGEALYVDNNLTDVPFVVGSLSSFVVDDGSYGFAVGDQVTISSGSGQQAVGRVDAIQDISGIVQFTLNDGGWGYTSNSQILISNTKFYLTNVHTTLLTNTTPISKFSTVIINNPANNAANVTANVFAFSTTANLYATPISGLFVVNETITSADTNANAVVKVVSSNVTTTTLSVANVYNSYFASGQVITGSISGAKATISSYDTNIGVISLSGSVTNSHTALYTTTGNATITGYSTGISASFSINQLNTTETIYTYADYVGGQSTLQTSTSKTGTFTNGNAFITGMSSTTGINGNSAITSSNPTVAAGLPALPIVTNIVNSTAVIMSGNYTGTTTAGASVTFTGNTAYTTIALNASSYGFPKLPSANLTNGYLVDIIGASVYNLGSIQSIITTNPGLYYNDNPYVEVYEPVIAPKRKQDYIINITTPVTPFIVGETVQQAVPISGVSTLATANVNGGSYGANVFTYGEVVYQSNNTAGLFLANTLSTLVTTTTGSTAALAAGQYVYIGAKDLRVVNNVVNTTAFYITQAPYTQNAAANVLSLSAAGAVLLISGNNLTTNTFSGTFVTTRNITGLSSGTTANLASVSTVPVNLSALGSIISANSTVLNVRRLSLGQDFVPTYAITGSQSGANVIVTAVAANTISAFSGDNANVYANTFSSKGTVKTLTVQSSGFGYVNAELITFTSSDKTRSGTAKTGLGKQGYAPGYYSSTKGFLSADKYIQDSDYYQGFSYEVRSSLDLTKYADMIKTITHVAGTKLFGAVIKKNKISTPVVIDNSNTSPIIGT